MKMRSRWAALGALAALPPAGAVVGGAIDEHTRLGFSTWQSACRATGISAASVLDFTLQLLPNAIVGTLLGALLVQMIACRLRHRRDVARLCLAAHAGCALAMPVGLLLCALALPVALMFLTEVALGVCAALVLLALPRVRRATYTRADA